MSATQVFVYFVVVMRFLDAVAGFYFICSGITRQPPTKAMTEFDTAAAIFWVFFGTIALAIDFTK